MQLIDLFSGLGGFSLAGKWMGWRTIQFCEIEKFPQTILKYYWPEVPIHGDIRTLTGKQIKNNGLYDKHEKSILVGGFPCQPFSQAGKRRGKEDDRYLWDEMCRVIDEFKPDYIVGENVFGITNMVEPFNEVAVEGKTSLFQEGEVVREEAEYVIESICEDLERLGYSVQPLVIPACAVNAPHRRDRVWFIAYSKLRGHQAGRGKETKENGIQGKDGKAMGSGKSDRASVSSTTPNPDINRQPGSTTQGDDKGINEQGIQKGGEPSTHSEGRNIEGNVRIASNSDSERQQKQGEQSVRGKERKPFGEFSEGDAADSTGKRWVQGECDNETRQPDEKDEKSDASYTGSQGLQGRELNKTPESRGTKREWEVKRQSHKSTSQLHQITNWEQFPTQSPVCQRDDELSTRLDGITFPKWRSESIKAYGNSVVVALVYEIFKVIQEYETLKNTQ